MSHSAQADERLAEVLFEHASEGMMVTDARNRILRVNPAFCAITGFEADEVIGRTPHVLSSGRHGRDFYAQLWSQLNESGRWEGEIWNRRKDGSVYPEWLSIVLLRDAEGRPQRHIAIFSDITRRRAQIDRLEARANFDHLTGLPNRELFMDRLHQALASAQRTGSRVAIAFLDLDRFKWVNDTWGHGAGDHLLQVVAQRLSSSVRACDTVGRFGGDEFALLLASVSSVDEVRAVVDRVLKSLGGAVSVSAEMIHPTASIGLALFPEHGQSAEVLLARADEAMYRAKQAGGGRHAVSGYPPS